MMAGSDDPVVPVPAHLTAVEALAWDQGWRAHAAQAAELRATAQERPQPAQEHLEACRVRMGRGNFGCCCEDLREDAAARARIVAPPALFHVGEYTLHAGGLAGWKIDCDALTEGDITALAYMIAERLPPFSAVEGVPRGGLRLAAMLQPFVSPDGPLLIVDDVLTTGGSMEAHRAGRDAIGAVIFARGSAGWPSWVTPLFQLAPLHPGLAAGRPLAPQPDRACQLCASGLPKLYLNTGTGIPWHRTEAGQLYKCAGRLPHESQEP